MIFSAAYPFSKPQDGRSSRSLPSKRTGSGIIVTRRVVFSEISNPAKQSLLPASCQYRIFLQLAFRYTMVGSNSKDDQVFRLSIAMIVLTGLSVIVRFLTRARLKITLATEEWWILLSLAFYYTYMGLQIWS